LITIIAAMKEEVAQLGDIGKRFNGKVAVTVTGVGKENVQSAMKGLFTKERRPSLVLSVGFSGALSDDLYAGDLVLARKVLLAKSDAAIEVSREYSRMAEDAINESAMPYVHRDSITAPNVVRTRAEKDALAQTYRVQAVDMEDYWVGLAAVQAGVPFLSVRAVLDMAHQELPSYVEELLLKKEQGQGLRIVLDSLARPARIPKLLSLARQSQKAQKSLGVFARTFVNKAVSRGVYATA
jgi:adenosylhomocysteine nucleosidase